MFQSICIKSKELQHQKIDIAFLVETMLFYGKVIVLAHKDELLTLLIYFGEDFLEELIKIGRLDLRIRVDILGSMNFPGDKYNIELLSKKGEDYYKVLYLTHRELTRNSIKNTAFANKFSKITSPFAYEKTIIKQIQNDFNNQELLSKSLATYLNAVVPNFILPEKLEIEIIKDSPFGTFDAYSLKSNLDINELNRTHKENTSEQFYPIDYSGFLLSLAESKGDIYIASQFDSEIVTNDLYSKFIKIQLNEIIQRRINSQENINLFGEYILENCYSIGDAFIKGIVSKGELLNLFEKADKFRAWLLKIPEDKNLIGEYYSAITKGSLVEKLPTKNARFVILEGLGIFLDILGTGGIGTALATTLSAFDHFYLDKLMSGWRPNQFIDKTLKPLIKK